MTTVAATVDIQFHPSGTGYAYPNGDTKAEKEKLAILLRVCGDIGTIFNALLPPAERDWWKTGLKLEVVDDKVAIEEIKKKVRAQLDSMEVTNQELSDALKTLPKTIVSFQDGSSYPPAPAAGSPPGEKALGFGVEAPKAGGRTYYGMPDGTVICCVALNLTDDVSNQAVMLADSTVSNGRVDVVLAVHFKSP